MSDDDAPTDGWKQARKELEAAIEKYAAINMERKGVVTCSVVFMHTQHWDDEGNEIYTYDYSCIHESSVIASLGLVDAGHELMKQHIHNSADWNDD